MKMIISVVLSIVFCFCFCGCNKVSSIGHDTEFIDLVDTNYDVELMSTFDLNGIWEENNSTHVHTGYLYFEDSIIGYMGSKEKILDISEFTSDYILSRTTTYEISSVSNFIDCSDYNLKIEVISLDEIDITGYNSIMGKYTRVMEIDKKNIGKQEDIKDVVGLIKDATGVSDAEAKKINDTLISFGVISFSEIYFVDEDDDGTIYWLDGVNKGNSVVGSADIGVSINLNVNNEMDFACIQAGRILYENGKVVNSFDDAVKEMVKSITK